MDGNKLDHGVDGMTNHRRFLVNAIVFIIEKGLESEFIDWMPKADQEDIRSFIKTGVTE